MKGQSQPGIVFEKFALERLMFEKFPDHKPGKITIDVQFGFNADVNTEGKRLTLKMQVNVFEEAKDPPFKIQLLVSGQFIADNADRLKEFSTVQAPALMFPFVREVIANITTKAGFPPLLLPPTNIQVLIGKTVKEKRQKNGSSGRARTT